MASSKAPVRWTHTHTIFLSIIPYNTQTGLTIITRGLITTYPIVLRQLVNSKTRAQPLIKQLSNMQLKSGSYAQSLIIIQQCRCIMCVCLSVSMRAACWYNSPRGECIVDDHRVAWGHGKTRV